MNYESTDSGRYRSAAITLDWIMAALILTQLFVAPVLWRMLPFMRRPPNV